MPNEELQSGHPLDATKSVPGRFKRIGSRSGPNGACVEVTQEAATGDVLVTDSKQLNDPPKRYTRMEWAVLVLACREGEYDDMVTDEIAMLLEQKPLAVAAIA